MKKKIALLLLLIPFFGFSQEKESALDKISKLTCEYLKSEKFKALSKSDKTSGLGLFIIGSYTKYQKELVEEGLEFDFSAEDGGRKFGEKVGVNMLKFCSEALIAFSKLEEDVVEEVEEKLPSMTGEITRIKGKEFSVVYLKDKENTIQKFVWLRNFMGSNKLIYADSVKGMKVKITYKNIEWYSPKIKEYIARKEITGIEFLKD